MVISVFPPNRFNSSNTFWSFSMGQIPSLSPWNAQIDKSLISAASVKFSDLLLPLPADGAAAAGYHPSTRLRSQSLQHISELHTDLVLDHAKTEGLRMIEV